MAAKAMELHRHSTCAVWRAALADPVTGAAAPDTEDVPSGDDREQR